ncbi:MAG: (5-formylfuran-3-yl)methyl phosphate synthase [Planctomycetaceae bacterium]
MRTIDGSRKLLVSVRDVEEAVDALAGGAEIIDVKEPTRGSLGRANEQTLSIIAQALTCDPSKTVMSAALGEVCDSSHADGYRVPDEVRFAKLGLSRLAGDSRWIERWDEVRKAYERVRGKTLDWVAVIYADDVAAQSPSGDEIIASAAETGCVGVLVDTWSKREGTLLDLAPVSKLVEWTERVHENGMFFAVAGRLSQNDLSRLCDVDADLIAVRSAVCQGQNRQARVEAERVAELLREINRMPALPTSMRRAFVDHSGH